MDEEDEDLSAVFRFIENCVSMKRKRSARIALWRSGRGRRRRPATGGESCKAGFISGEHTLRERWDVQMGECGKLKEKGTITFLK